MMLLIAALLAADVDTEAPRTAEASLQAGLGLRGERRAELGAKAREDDVSLSLGAAESAGPQAPQRQEMSLGIEAPLVRGALRVVPRSAGLLLGAAELGVHSETLGLILGARAGDLGKFRLRAAGLRLELEGDLLDDLRGGVSASAWALSLTAPPSADPWGAWGNATLDWAQRWEVGGWASHDFGALSLTPSLSFAQPAQAGAFETRAALGAEVPLGPAKLRAEAALGRLWPTAIWHGELSAGLVLSL